MLHSPLRVSRDRPLHAATSENLNSARLPMRDHSQRSRQPSAAYISYQPPSPDAFLSSRRGVELAPPCRARKSWILSSLSGEAS